MIQDGKKKICSNPNGFRFWVPNLKNDIDLLSGFLKDLMSKCFIG